VRAVNSKLMVPKQKMLEEKKLVVMLEGLARRFESEERKALQWMVVGD